MIRVAVAGAAGRMGETGGVRRSDGAEDMELVGRADPLLGTGLEEALKICEAPEVLVVDFTQPDTARATPGLPARGRARGDRHDGDRPFAPVEAGRWAHAYGRPAG